MLLEKPYFLKNKEWLVNNVPYFLVSGAKQPKDRQYILTDKAPQKAIDSYNEYYKLLESQTINEETILWKRKNLKRKKS